MDDSTRRSTAGPRQFENTAIAKLVARGVPKHVAEAFVRIGLPKSGRIDSIKDVVCKMEYKKFFVESTVADFKDPLRVGSYTPHVVESKETKFYCEYQMSDLDSAKFAKIFPEFDIIARGRSYNQHAFYANKRYAEAELLVGMVFRDSRTSELDPHSLVDLGGNDAWHVKRGRDFVHCDNPMLSARDKMRYESRQIFSGSDRAQVCDKSFVDCDKPFDYAIGVHSTYDMSPKEVAYGMHRRGIKRFYGVINYIPGIEDKPEGLYELDGLEMEVVRPIRGSAVFRCGFKHDPSLRYSHKLTTLRKYLVCQQQYTFVSENGTATPYTYTVRSVRGNSVVFSIDDISRGSNLNSSSWASTITKSYRISMDALGVKGIEVDCEFFDRLVLQAASARNASQFDIVSLFRYAKSLRQRVSMNGIVLSSGFTFNPDELVYSTIAAYAIALAYRHESTNFFKQASAQIANLRSGGVIKDVIAIAAQSLRLAATAVPVAFARVSGLVKLDERIKELVKSNVAVRVEVEKPGAGKGNKFDPTLFSKRYVMARLKALRDEGLPVTPYSKYYGAALLPTRVLFSGVDTTFFSRGLVAYDSAELPKSAANLKIYDVGSFTIGSNRSVENVRVLQYAEMFKTLRLIKSADEQALVMPNGDRMYRLGLSSVQGRRDMQSERLSFVSNTVPFVIFRGVGRYVVSLKPPKRYAQGCIGFYLFFESRVDSLRLVNSSPGLNGPLRRVDLREISSPSLTLAPTTYGSDAAWDVVESSGSTQSVAGQVVAFSTDQEAREFTSEALQEGEYYMSGALIDDPPLTPPADHDEFVRDATVSTMGLSQTAPEGEDINYQAEEAHEGGTVSSSDVVTGKDSMDEYLYVAKLVEEAAVGGARQVIDIAKSAASGDAPRMYFLTAASQLPGGLRAVQVEYGDDGVSVRDVFDKSDCDHMAVTDGKSVYDLRRDRPPPGTYVTSDALMVYTAGAISESVRQATTSSYDCPVTCVDGIAGSGKTYHIVHNAHPQDVVLCETRASLQDTARDLSRLEGWKGHAYTVDSFLINRQVDSCETLWVDEAFRLHAGKLFALMKLLKPKAMYCFGDSKQIPSLSFVPMYDFKFDRFPFTKIQVKKETWRFGADVCFALSQEQFYGYHALTHVPVLRSFVGPKSFVQGSLHNRGDSVVLTYTRTAKDDLVNQGVEGVMTIGESQGKTFDHVIIFRDTNLNKALYFDNFQALVGVTRHRRSCTYLTVSVPEIDESSVARLMRYVSSKSTEVLLSSHVTRGVRPAADYTTLEARQQGRGDDSDAASAFDVVSLATGFEELTDSE